MEPLVDVVRDRVDARTGDVVVGPTESRVELEELRPAVARVVLEVEVRVADPLQLGEQARGLVDDLGVLVGEELTISCNTNTAPTFL